MLLKSTRSGASGKSLGSKWALRLPVALVSSDYGHDRARPPRKALSPGADLLLQIHRRRGKLSSSGGRSNEMKRKELEVSGALEKSAGSTRKVARTE
jgi:hypothetical protein